MAGILCKTKSSLSVYLDRSKVDLVRVGLCLLLAACIGSPRPGQDRTSSPVLQSETSASEVEMARAALEVYFDALYRGDYQTAAEYYGGTYYNLQWMYPQVDPQDYAGLLAKACSPDSRFAFRCWKLRDVLQVKRIGPGRYGFLVRFEDEQGNLLLGGDNRTAVVCVPPEDCPRSRYHYTVSRQGDVYLVEELPVCLMCWP